MPLLDDDLKQEASMVVKWPTWDPCGIPAYWAHKWEQLDSPLYLLWENIYFSGCFIYSSTVYLLCTLWAVFWSVFLPPVVFSFLMQKMAPFPPVLPSCPSSLQFFMCFFKKGSCHQKTSEDQIMLVWIRTQGIIIACVYLLKIYCICVP